MGADKKIDLKFVVVLLLVVVGVQAGELQNYWWAVFWSLIASTLASLNLIIMVLERKIKEMNDESIVA